LSRFFYLLETWKCSNDFEKILEQEVSYLSKFCDEDERANLKSVALGSAITTFVTPGGDEDADQCSDASSMVDTDASNKSSKVLMEDSSFINT
jgi:hypothetical protein